MPGRDDGSSRNRAADCRTSLLFPGKSEFWAQRQNGQMGSRPKSTQWKRLDVRAERPHKTRAVGAASGKSLQSWNDWWRTQSDSNPSPARNSLPAGKMQGILANLNQIRQKWTVNAVISRGFFAEFPTQSCREFEDLNPIASREFGSSGNSIPAPGAANFCSPGNPDSAKLNKL